MKRAAKTQAKIAAEGQRAWKRRWQGKEEGDRRKQEMLHSQKEEKTDN